MRIVTPVGQPPLHSVSAHLTPHLGRARVRWTQHREFTCVFLVIVTRIFFAQPNTSLDLPVFTSQAGGADERDTWEEEAKERVTRMEGIKHKRRKEAKGYLSTTSARGQEKGAARYVKKWQKEKD